MAQQHDVSNDVSNDVSDDIAQAAVSTFHARYLDRSLSRCERSVRAVGVSGGRVTQCERRGGGGHPVYRTSPAYRRDLL
jgi:hypothetical protein